MSNFFRRLFCRNPQEILNNENEDSLVTKTPTLDKLTEIETILNSKLASLELKLEQKLENNSQKTLNVVENVPLSIAQINNKLDLLQKKLQEVEEKVDKTLVLAEKKSVLAEKSTQIDILQDKKEGDLKEGADATVSTINHSADPFEDITVGANWKELRFLSKSYKPLFPINHNSLQNIKLKRKGDKLTYLEMYIAIRAQDNAVILLSPVQNPGVEDHVFEIVVGGNCNTALKMSHSTERSYDKKTYVVECDINNILPTNGKFGKYFIKIEKGTLQFGVTEKSPGTVNLLTNHTYFTYEDEQLSSIKFFGFNLFPQNEHMFIFDCPNKFSGVLRPVYN